MSRDRILNGFTAPIEPLRSTLAYRGGILLAAIVMLLLPLVYLALIGLVGYLVYLHAIYDAGIMSSVRGRAVIWAFLVYLAPMVIGVILVLFMLKPLFARHERGERFRALNREAEPLLFEFVDRICAAVGAPAPRRIDVDCQVNASASFRRGWLSLFTNDLVLTIGMPLIAGLSLQQFAGVLAHEFGHFSQGAGMRLTYIVRSISFWFTRVVYERDDWDGRLVAWANEVDIRIGWIFHLARLCVWLTRKILWVLMMCGHAVAGFLLRQMEFDADRYEARLAGSDAFEATVHRLAVLNAATQRSYSDLGEYYREGRLADNLPRLIQNNVERMPDDVRKLLDKIVAESKTGWFDTHPSDQDRIASARRENAPGVYRVEGPADALFANFDAHCRESTWEYYRSVFGKGLKRDELHPVEDLLERTQRSQAGSEATKRFFHEHFLSLRPLVMPHWFLARDEDPKQLVAKLRSARETMKSLAATYGAVAQKFDAADTRVVEAYQAMTLHHSSLRFKSDAFSVAMPSLDAAKSVRRSAGAEQERLALELRDFEVAAGQRLYAALALLQVPQVAARVADAPERLAQCVTMLPVLATVCNHFDLLMRLRNSNASLSIAIANLNAHAESQDLISTVRRLMKDVYDDLVTLREGLNSTNYPFEHAKGSLSLADFTVPAMPAPDDLGGIYHSAGQALEALPTLYVRLVGQLCLTAEMVEQALTRPQTTSPARGG